MHRMHNRILRKQIKRTCIGFVILLALAGCATNGKVKPTTASQESSLEKGFTVAQLEDGRQGFIITEVPQMDEASRKDFEQKISSAPSQ